MTSLTLAWTLDIHIPAEHLTDRMQWRTAIHDKAAFTVMARNNGQLLWPKLTCPVMVETTLWIPGAVAGIGHMFPVTQPLPLLHDVSDIAEQSLCGSLIGNRQFITDSVHRIRYTNPLHSEPGATIHIHALFAYDAATGEPLT